jgi:hypothetical protein
MEIIMRNLLLIIVLFFSKTVLAEEFKLDEKYLTPNIKMNIVEEGIESNDVSIFSLLDNNWEIIAVLPIEDSNYQRITLINRGIIRPNTDLTEQTIARAREANGKSKHKLAVCKFSFRSGTKRCYFWESQEKEKWEQKNTDNN